jgi:ribonuclease P protein component
MTNLNLKVPKESIPYILKKGESYKSNLFIVRFIKNDGTFFRHRVIISKKLLSKAVQRNKLRRQIYEILRIQTKETPKSTNFDLILIPKKNITASSFQEIEKDITENIIKKSYE